MAYVTTAGTAVFRDRPAAEALAYRLGVSDLPSIAAGADVAVPLLVDAIRRQAAEPAEGAELAEVVGLTVAWGLADPVEEFGSGRYAPSGHRLIDQLLASNGDRGEAIRSVAGASGLTIQAAAEVLAASAWVVGAQLHQRTGSPIVPEALVAVVDDAPPRVRPPAPQSSLAPIVVEPQRSDGQNQDGAASSAPSASPDRSSSRSVSPSAPVSPASAQAPAPPMHPMHSPAINRQSHEEREPVRVRPVPAARYSDLSPDDDLDIDRGPNYLITGLSAILGLMIVAVGLWWWLDRDGDDGATLAGSGGADTTEDLASPPVDEGDAETSDGAGAIEDGDGTATEGEAAADAPYESADGAEGGGIIGPDGLASLDISMTDPIGRSTATGFAGLRFDQPAGQICYEIGLDGIGAPADGHIHLGPTGVKGGIVVDFGPMDDGLIGCMPVEPAEIEAILADLDGHYVELHDPVEEFTIRAQLSEGIGPDGQPASSGQPAAEPTDTENLLFDPAGGGAIAIVEPGRIVVRGEVADREVAERVLIDFAGLSEVLVVDELTVVDDAPLPSGRAIIQSPDTGLFASGSDELDPGVEPLIDQLVDLLVEARPDWRLTVVGHTDSTGNDVINLELSLRRAEAVRSELIAAGVAPDRIRVRGAGSTDPLADNATVEGRAQNRRTEVEIER